MDIIIRNGVILKDEKENVNIKKDYNKEYHINKPGHNYDLIDSHMHIARFPHQIINFVGPQISNKIKMDFYDFDKKSKYCCICHKLMNTNVSFPAKRQKFENIINYEYSISKSLNDLNLSNFKELINTSLINA